MATKAKKPTKKHAAKKPTKKPTKNPATCNAVSANGRSRCTLHPGHRGTHYDSLTDRSFARGNHPKPVPEKLEWTIPGRTPTPERLDDATKLTCSAAQTYWPARVTKTRAYIPWLVRRLEKLGQSVEMTWRALAEAAKRTSTKSPEDGGKLTLWADHDLPPIMSRSDLERCPHLDDGAPIVWVTWTDPTWPGEPFPSPFAPPRK